MVSTWECPNRSRWRSTVEDVTRRFETRAANPGQIALMEDLREAYLQLAIVIGDVLPDGREKSLAMTHLEDSSMRAIRAVLEF